MRIAGRVINSQGDYILAFSNGESLKVETLAEGAIYCRENDIDFSHDVNIAHGDLKGSFTCLGNHYNLFHKESMARLEAILKKVRSTRDQKTAAQEIAEAKLAAEKWQREPYLNWLYDYANAIGEWDTTF